MRALLRSLAAVTAVAGGTALLEVDRTAHAWGTEFYVALTGSDTNPGTAGQPFLTFERAATAVRGAMADPKGQGPITVWIRAGTYQRTQPWVLTEADSGTPARPITWSAHPGERVEISGMRNLDTVPGSWTTQDGFIWSRPAGGLRFSSLFVNGQRATRARHPNVGYQAMGWRQQCCIYDECCAGHSGCVPQPQLSDVCLDRFPAAPGVNLAGWARLNEVEVVSRRRWEQSRLRIDQLQGQQVLVRRDISGLWFGFDYDGQDRYYLENAYEALDAAGEWYLDTVADRLYYATPEFSNELTFEVPVANELLRAGDVAGAAEHWQEDLVTVLNDDDLRFGSENFSIAAWVYLPADLATCTGANLTCAQPVACKGDPYRAKGYCVTITRSPSGAGQAFLNMSDGSGPSLYVSAGSVPTGTWTHVAWVVNRTDPAGPRTTAYRNGAFFGIGGVPAGDIGSWRSFEVGRFSGSNHGEIGYRYEGRVDEMHAMAGTLSAAGVSQLYTNNWQNELAERLFLRFETPDAMAEQNGHLLETRGRFQPAPGVFGSQAAAFNKTPVAGTFSGYLKSVVFRGLEFRGTDVPLPPGGYSGSQSDTQLLLPAAVTLVAQDGAFDKCTITATGAAGLRVLGQGEHVTVNEIRDTGGAGIEVGRLSPRYAATGYADYAGWRSAASALTRNVLVIGNRVHAVGRRFAGAPGIVVARSDYNQIANNRVYDTGYSGISVGWVTLPDYDDDTPPILGNLVQGNEVHHTMQVLNDGAGIYLWGNQPSGSLTNNVVHDVRRTSLHADRPGTGSPLDQRQLLFGLYLDGTAANVQVRNNVVYNTENGGLMLGGCGPGTLNHDNVAENNIFANAQTHQLGVVNACQDASRHNIIYTNTSGPFFFDLAGSALRESNYNLFYRTDGNQSEFLAWQARGYDSASVFANPLFVNPLRPDLGLQPGSPAFAPPVSFQAIDTSMVGPWEVECFEDFDCVQQQLGDQCIQRVCQ
jgi:hypothetical protein